MHFYEILSWIELQTKHRLMVYYLFDGQNRRNERKANKVLHQIPPLKTKNIIEYSNNTIPFFVLYLWWCSIMLYRYIEFLFVPGSVFDSKNIDSKGKSQILQTIEYKEYEIPQSKNWIVNCIYALRDTNEPSTIDSRPWKCRLSRVAVTIRICVWYMSSIVSHGVQTK